MRHFVRRALAIATASVVAVLAGVTESPVLAGPGVRTGSITSGPLTLTVKEAPYFLVGTQESLADYCGKPYYEGGRVRLGIAATSPYGIASWDTAVVTPADDSPYWVHHAQSAPPVVAYDLDNYTNFCGGSQANSQGFVIRVTDKHNNVAVLEDWNTFDFMRWDNSSPGASFGTFTYSPGWAVAKKCAKCDDGKSSYTTKTGATATFTLDPSWTDGGATAGHLGLVMTEGPGHGVVKLYLDGQLKASVDTYSKTWKYRTYAYDFGPLSAGAHTVTLVNAGTGGRSRIDLQGIGFTYGFPCVPADCPA
jgi:hypothetical protein